MTLSNRRLDDRLALGLALAIALTRIPGIFSFQLPDATLAAFFLGGLALAQPRSFGWLLLVAFLADWVAFQTGLAPWSCLTPAYVFLVPAYGLVWGAGRLTGKCGPIGYLWLTNAMLWALLGLSAAFIVSNAGFYAATAAATGLGGWAYAETVGRYFPAYAGDALVYLIPVLLAVLWSSQSRRASPSPA
ncbi:hypothetical protein ACW73L_01790 [Methylolobus aquaticus]